MCRRLCYGMIWVLVGVLHGVFLRKRGFMLVGADEKATAQEVKKFLVCGKRKDALKCAQEGELWGIALVVARQLGEKVGAEVYRD